MQNQTRTYRSTFSALLSVILCAICTVCHSEDAAPEGYIRISSNPDERITPELPEEISEPNFTKTPVTNCPQCPPLEVHFAERVEYSHCVPEPETRFFGRMTEHFFEALSHPVEPMSHLFEGILDSEHTTVETKLNSRPLGIQAIPSRPELFIEENEPFLDAGFFDQGVEIPTGAIWRPSLWVFGQYRTAIQYQDNQVGQPVAEWTNRLDLFGQLNLSGTERILLGLRPFDQERSTGRRFTGVDFYNGEWSDGANPRIQTLFFEGDFGEIFPNLDPHDELALDYGFSIGRQPLSFQQGLLINEDMIDAVTVTRNTLNGRGNLNLRITGVYAWDKINRNNNQWDDDAQLVGLFTESDFLHSTINADIAYVDSSNPAYGSLLAFGLSAIRRFHGHENTYNSSTHILASIPTEGETATSGRGVLLFSQLSWTAHHSEDLIYLNGFYVIDQFTSPSRGRVAGGPLGQTGILFASAGLGQTGAPLSNQASDAAGGSLGYQMFFDETKQQVVLEFGGRQGTKGTENGALGFAGRYQKAIDQHWIFIIDTFATKTEGRNVAPGARIEFLAKF